MRLHLNFSARVLALGLLAPLVVSFLLLGLMAGMVWNTIAEGRGYAQRAIDSTVNFIQGSPHG